MTAGYLATQALAEAPAPSSSVNKWQVFRDLTTARSHFGLSSRSLTVLSALLSFHPGDMLEDRGPLIVFPSNRTLGERAHGMAESTLRRHLAALLDAGLIARHDSPNGKRYATRTVTGRLSVAFGFDLRPLLVRAAEIAHAAAMHRVAQAQLSRRREAIVLQLRDAAKILDYLTGHAGCPVPTDLTCEADDLRRELRRRLTDRDLNAVETRIVTLMVMVDKLLEIHLKATKPSGYDGGNERHIQDSNQNTYESEGAMKIHAAANDAKKTDAAETAPPLPLALVTEACPALTDYAQTEIQHWRDLVSEMDQICPWLGITPETWQAAKRQMGPCTAAVVAACILQRADRILSPGGYLRDLTRRSAEGRFRPEPMVMALLGSRSEDNRRSAA